MQEAATDQLLFRFRECVERAAGRERRTLVSVTAPVEGIDPCAAVFASRLASDHWFCWEQPHRGFALATLGVAHQAASRGKGRFEDVARESLRLCEGAVVEEPVGIPAGAGHLPNRGGAGADRHPHFGFRSRFQYGLVSSTNL